LVENVPKECQNENGKNGSGFVLEVHGWDYSVSCLTCFEYYRFKSECF
jgi:hypothetical protein